MQRLGEFPVARWRPDRFTLFLLLLALAGAGLVLAFHGRNGVLLDWDSVNYISVADSLLAGKGFRQFNGQVYGEWPPLYPLLLAAPGLVGIDPYHWAGWLSASAYALTIFVAGQWLRQRLTSRLLLLWGCLAVALAYTPARWAAFALTETIFILFTLLGLLAAERFLNTERRSALLMAALFTALACLTRYLGLTLAATLILLLALQSGVPLQQRARHIALYGLLALAPLGLWLLRNWLLLGNLTGRQSYETLTFGESVQQTLGVLADWTVLPGLLPALNFLPAVLLLVLAAALIYGLGRATATGPARPPLRPLYSCGLFALVYLILFNVVAYQATFATAPSRYILPVWLPLLLTALFTLDWLGQSIKEVPAASSRRVRQLLYRGRLLFLGALFLTLPLWLAWQIFLSGQQLVRAWDGQPDSYSDWAEDDIFQQLRESDLTGSWEWILSNFPAAVYIYGGRPPQQGELPYDRLDLQQWMARGEVGPAAVYVVWLYDSPDATNYRYDDQDLRNLPNAETVAELESGVVLRLRRETAASPAYRVHLSGNRLFYRKSPCYPSDVQPAFFLHIYPGEPADLPAGLPAGRPAGQPGFAGQDFYLAEFGRREGDRCFMERELPAYPIREIRTGQYRVTEDGRALNLWQDSFHLDPTENRLRPFRPPGWSQFAAAGSGN